MQFLWAMSLRLTSSRFSGRRSRVVIRQIELTGCRIAAGTPVSVDLLQSLLIHTQLFFTFPYYYDYYANGFSVGYGRLLGWL